MWIDNVSDFHQTITHDAVEIANRHPDKHPQFFFTAASTAAEQTVRGLDGIAMEWDREGGLQHFTREEQRAITDTMNRVAKEAVQQSLKDNADLFVGVIVGEARKGRNYFDSFVKQDA